tara:strand:- start:4 stop:255 length:252 start_codon:yes stop_codon:yes gene_type:complete
MYPKKANGSPLGTKRGKKGEFEISGRKPIPYLLSPPKDMGYQSLPSPPQPAEDPPSLIQGKEPLLPSLCAHYGYWFISFPLCL